MEQGLDRLIESLLTEIAFSGAQGCSVSTLLGAIDAFYPRHHGRQPPSGNDKEYSGQYERPENVCFSLHAKVWGWLVARNDVSIGENRCFNNMRLGDILALPEKPVETQILDSDAQPLSSSNQDGKTNAPDKNYRPRLFVSEDRQWRTLAGHGPDPKRIPQFEWRALIDIASMKEKGILQGDLVRLTGQDKRSLPNRTEALAQKGYIIKQPVLLRGSRTSKLWLAHFADKAQEDAKKEGLSFEEIDLSRETLTGDLKPVAFDSYWNGQTLDYLAIAQAFIAVVKAWGVMRYCDLRVKLNLEGRVPQMRALAKTSRWLTDLGSVAFVAAQFPNNPKVFRDCVKFLRDPTPREWQEFRSIPRKAMSVPSQRLGKRGQNSRARAKKALSLQTSPKPGGPAHSGPGLASEEEAQILSTTEFAPHLRSLQKPFAASVFDIMKRSGQDGTSNAQIAHLSLGWDYRKYISALTASMSSTRASAKASDDFRVTSQLRRIGKTSAYQFFAPGFPRVESEPTQTDPAIDQSGQTDLAEQSVPAPPQLIPSKFGFLEPPQDAFTDTASASLSEITGTAAGQAASGFQQGKPRRSYGYRKKSAIGARASSKVSHAYRRQPASQEQGEGPLSASRVSNRASDRTRRSATDAATSWARESEEEDQGDTVMTFGDSERASSLVEDEPKVEDPPRLPGVHRGIDNSLDPPGKKGRRRKSIVLIIRTDALKDRDFLVKSARRPRVEHDVTSVNQYQPEVTSTEHPSEPQPQDEEPTPGLESPCVTPRQKVTGQTPQKKRGRGAAYRCDKCGSSWKNPNGLEYHQNKSQTPCNPSFIASKSPIHSHKQRLPQANDRRVQLAKLHELKQRQVSQREAQAPSPSDSRSSTHPRDSSSHRTENTLVRPEDKGGSVILQDVQLYNVPDSRAKRHRSESTREQTEISPSPQKRLKGAQNRDSIDLEKAGADLIGPEGHKEQPWSNSGPVTAGIVNTCTSQKDDVCSDAHVLEHKIQHQEHQPGNRPRSGILPSRKVTDKDWGPNEAGVRRAAKSPEPTAHSANSKSEELSDPKNSDPLTTQPKNGRLMDPKTRKQRTSETILHLLEKNDGVFPGDFSLYVGLASVWSEKFEATELPDRRTCTTVLNALEKEGLLAQMHFLFLDQQGNNQDIRVIVQTEPGVTRISHLSADPRVVSVKDKVKTAFPKTYVPEQFSFSANDTTRLNALASKYWGKGRLAGGRGYAANLGLASAREVEVLHYPSPVVSGILREDRPSRISDTKGSKPEVKVRSSEVASPPRNTHTKCHSIGSWESACPQSQDWVTSAWNTDFEAPGQWTHQDFGPQFGLPTRTPLKLSYGNVPGPRRKRKFGANESFSPSNSSTHTPKKPRRNFKDIEDLRRPSPNVPSAQLNSENHDAPFALNDGAFSVTGIADSAAKMRRIKDDGSQGEIRFGPIEHIQNGDEGSWPTLAETHFENDDTSFTLSGLLPTATWFLNDNLPHSVQDILKTTKRQVRVSAWADVDYGELVRQVNAVRTWEVSPDGARILLSGLVASEVRFLNVFTGSLEQNQSPITLDWSAGANYTPETMPAEILDTTPEDADFGLELSTSREPRTKDSHSSSDGGRKSRGGKKQGALLAQSEDMSESNIEEMSAPAEPEQGCVEYKTRALATLPPAKQGRATKSRISSSLSGFTGFASENELIVTFVVFKTLIGGVGAVPDYARILKLYPELSLSGLKKFWPRVAKQRKRYIEVLTEKFQSAFLEAYEKGEFPALDFERLDEYDWPSLVLWATKLETHEDVDLPWTRRILDQEYSLEKPQDDLADWREIWFSPAAIHARFAANINSPASMPVGNMPKNGEDLTLARSWVRSLCCTPLKAAGVSEKVGEKLLELGDGDIGSTNDILQRVVQQLIDEKTVAKTKGKSMGHTIRLNAVFSNQIKKFSEVEKFHEAAVFKQELDRSFRLTGEYSLPYHANDGTILALINLQCGGRVQAEAADYRSIPFGFQPGSYEGRLLSKDNYRFEVKLRPTDLYAYDEDLPFLGGGGGGGAAPVPAPPPPLQGPGGALPIWADLFGVLNRERWHDYLTMATLALATKGPLTARTAAALLKPVMEPFEARLVMGYLDKLGLLRRFMDSEGAMVSEWWWLVIGRMVRGGGGGGAESITAATAPSTAAAE